MRTVKPGRLRPLAFDMCHITHMNHDQYDADQPFFESSETFDVRRIRAAAVYCSDGRFGAQFDELMRDALGLPRYDRLAVPGGAACLASHFDTYRENEVVADQLEFLVRVHGLQRVVLIAHENCAFYTDRLRVSPLQLESQQREDMLKAINRVRSIQSNLTIDAFFARVGNGGTIDFEVVA